MSNSTLLRLALYSGTTQTMKGPFKEPCYCKTPETKISPNVHLQIPDFSTASNKSHLEQ